MLGIVQTSKKEYAAAEAAFMKAIELAPDWQPPQNSLASIYLLQGNESKAIEKFQSSLRANPRNPAAYVTLGAIYERKKQTDKAIEVYEQALAAIPNFWQAANNLAFLLSEYSTDKAQHEKALMYAKKALRLSPNVPAILDTVGWTYYKLGDLPKARSFLEQAMEQSPDAAEMNYHLGQVLYDSGNIEAAKEKISKALAGDADFYGRKEAEKLLEKMKQ
jgi:tetratricopeptide (TPR) repeat protein